jgi:CPA2 family monovalent cation:H+ antiporter-2
MTVGMGIAPGLIRAHFMWIFLSVFGLAFIKAGVIAPLVRAFGLTWGQAVESGFLLGQSGEFVFVVVGSAMALHVLPEGTGQFMLVVTSLSMIATPFIAMAARQARILIDRGVTAASIGDGAIIPDLQGHVIVAGAGRVGRAICRVLDEEAIPYVSIEKNTATVTERRRAGSDVYYGDATRVDLLKLFHPGRATAIVLTMDDARGIADALEGIRQHWPDVPVYARAKDKRVARVLHKAGASAVVAETVETGLNLIGHLLRGLGTQEEVVARRLDTERERVWKGITEE